MHGRHVPQAAGPLKLQVRGPDGEVQIQHVEHPGPFRLDIPVPKPAACPAYWSFEIEAEGGFVPAAQDAASDDQRHLACRIDGLKLRRGR